MRGVYDPPEANPLLADVVVTQKAFDSAYSQPKNSFTFLDAKPGSAAAIKAAAKGYGDAKYHTGAAYPKDATKDMADGPGHALRAARLLGDREPVRHGQHDGALGVRAHP